MWVVVFVIGERPRSLLDFLPPRPSGKRLEPRSLGKLRVKFSYDDPESQGPFRLPFLCLGGKDAFMRLGFETVVWGRRVDDLDHMAAVLASCGYEGVELAQCHRDIYVREGGSASPIRTIANLRKRLKAHGLELLGLVGGTLEERMAFCRDDPLPWLYLDSWCDWYEEVLVKEPAYRLALHPHWFMPMRKLRQAEAVLARISNPKLQLIVDTAHAIIAEDDPVAAVQKHLDRLAAVHLKDWKPDFGRWSHRYAHGFCPAGTGIVPVEEVIQVLAARGYEGWLLMEQDHFETSREQTALDCAKWAARWAGKCFHQFSPNERRVKALEKQRSEAYFRLSLEQVENEVRTVQQLSLAPSRGPDFFYPTVVRLLRQAFDAEAVKLWSYNPFTDELCLLAVSLEEWLPEKCGVLHKRTESLSGGIIDSPRVMLHDLHDPNVRSRFDDADFLAALQSRWMLTIPVLNSSNPHHLRYILTVFHNHERHGELSESERRGAEHYADLLSIWADYLTDEMCSGAAGATNHLCCEERSGVVPFINALMKHLEKLFHCENATVFLVDESRTRLEPAGDTVDRVTWREGVHPNQRCYGKGEGLTGTAWEEREMRFSSHAPNTEGHEGKSCEKTKLSRREVLIAPLARRGGDLLGVVRLHNKLPQRPGLAATAFTDDDAAKLDAVIQAALPHLDLLNTQRRQAYALTRLTHELQNPLVGILGATDWLRESLRPRKGSELRPELKLEYIEDILSYQELMSRLVSTASVFGASLSELKPKFEATDLATSVVIPVCKQLRALLKQYGLASERIDLSKIQGVLPWLHVDRAMFQQVFFNLFVNAIKYHDPTERFHVEVEAKVEGETKNPLGYSIIMTDWGIGLDEGENPDYPIGEDLFLPGVRGMKAAQLRDVAGTGVGLAVVRSVIQAHGGSVEFTSARKPTKLRIRLPAELRHMSPKALLKRTRGRAL